MEAVETVALEFSSYTPKLWFRFIVWPHGTEILQLFLEHLNNQHYNITFIMEIR